jgi:hypothetical protein
MGSGSASADAKPDDDPHYLLALEFESAGRFVEARNEVELAIAAGAGRDAKLLAAKLAILRERPRRRPANLLEPLAGDGKPTPSSSTTSASSPSSRNEYNNARTAYIAALKADPNYAAGPLQPRRPHLGRRRASDEAKHHAEQVPGAEPGRPARRRAAQAASSLDGPPPADPATTPATTKPFESPTDTATGPGSSPPPSGDLANPTNPASTSSPRRAVRNQLRAARSSRQRALITRIASTQASSVAVTVALTSPFVIVAGTRAIGT